MIAHSAQKFSIHRSASGPSSIALLRSTTPPVSSTSGPPDSGNFSMKSALSASELVMIRSFGESRNIARCAVVLPPSTKIAPDSGSSSATRRARRSLTTVNHCRRSASGNEVSCSVASCSMRPWTRRTAPASARRLNSRRMVGALNFSTSAASFAVRTPRFSTSSRMIRIFSTRFMAFNIRAGGRFVKQKMSVCS